jgi:hypothetical protein
MLLQAATKFLASGIDVHLQHRLANARHRFNRQMDIQAEQALIATIGVKRGK